MEKAVSENVTAGNAMSRRVSLHVRRTPAAQCARRRQWRLGPNHLGGRAQV